MTIPADFETAVICCDIEAAWAIAKEAGRKETLELCSLRPMEKRLAWAILEGFVSLKQTQQAMAEGVSGSRESVTRIVNKWRWQGIVQGWKVNRKALEGLL